MKYPLIINDTEDELVVRFGVAEEGIIWHLIRAICDGDKQERIFGIELFLY